MCFMPPDRSLVFFFFLLTLRFEAAGSTFSLHG